MTSPDVISDLSATRGQTKWSPTSTTAWRATDKNNIQARRSLGVWFVSKEPYNVRVNHEAWEHWPFVLGQNHHSHKSLFPTQSPRKALGSVAPDRNIFTLWSLGRLMETLYQELWVKQFVSALSVLEQRFAGSPLSMKNFPFISWRQMNTGVSSVEPILKHKNCANVPLCGQC